MQEKDLDKENFILGSKELVKTENLYESAQVHSQ